MFAVIKTGGKQYKVAENDVILVEKLTAEAGTLVALDDVLMMGEQGQEATIGAEALAKAAVFAEVLEQTRGDKIVIFKKKRRHNYRRKKGHRQDLTVLRIASISATGEKPKDLPKKAAPKKAEAAPETDAPKKAAPKKAAPKKAAPKKAADKAPAKAKAKAPAKSKSKE